jgi:hypothetical protein
VDREAQRGLAAVPPADVVPEAHGRVGGRAGANDTESPTSGEVQRGGARGFQHRGLQEVLVQAAAFVEDDARVALAAQLLNFGLGGQAHALDFDAPVRGGEALGPVVLDFDAVRLLEAVEDGPQNISRLRLGHRNERVDLARDAAHTELGRQRGGLAGAAPAQPGLLVIGVRQGARGPRGDLVGQVVAWF